MTSHLKIFSHQARYPTGRIWSVWQTAIEKLLKSPCLALILCIKMSSSLNGGWSFFRMRYNGAEEIEGEGP